MTSLHYEREACGPAVGVDEAGRGPLAGPVFAAAVHVPVEAAERLLQGGWAQVTDSKRLSPLKRENLAQTIRSEPACAWAVATASAREIDEMNILNATHLAMRRAVERCAARIPRRAGTPFILVDGLPVKGLPFPSLAIVKGDSASLLVAAASILAKTARDAYCAGMERLYPGYGFAAHKGYPVPAHIEAIRRLGPCPEHRMTFGPVAQRELF